MAAKVVDRTVSDSNGAMAATERVGAEAAMKLQGKNILLTGGSRGLGWAILQAFASEGANILFCSRDEKQLASTRDEITKQLKAPQKLVAQTCDISEEQSVGLLFDKFSEQFASL